MIIMAAIDNAGGMLFNHRRVSMDRVLREKIVEISGGSVLRMDGYSARQFREGLPPNAVVSETFLDEAGDGDFCFVEDRETAAYRDKIEKICLFKWNRDYPSDFKFDICPEQEGMRLAETEDFPGYSHDDITMEVWNRGIYIEI